MNRKGFLSISVIYTLFMVFLMLLLSVLAAYTNNRILLRLSKEDVSDILIESQDSRDIAFACQQEKLGECLAKKYYLDPNLYYHDKEVDIKTETTTYTASLEDGDGNYRYSGSNPNNYICFGTDNKDLCITQKDTYLYRIIGVFNNRLKIIKNSYETEQRWSNSALNEWVESSLKNQLNNAFLNSIPAGWQTKIMENTWNTAELTYSSVVTQANAPQRAYDAEKASDITFDAKVGLMSLSDYYYAAKPDLWTYKGDKQSGGGLDYGDAQSNNWLASNKVEEYTINSQTSTTNNVYKILSSGKVGADRVDRYLKYRPVLVLYPNLVLKDGNGTAENPYIVESTSATGSDVFDESLLANYIIKRKDNSLILHDGKADYTGQLNINFEVGDNAYRYAGASGNVNNWVCFGSDNLTCPTTNLYRIIGIFDDNLDGKYNVKLIKADYIMDSEMGTDGSYSGKIQTTTVNYKGDESNKSKLVEFYWNTSNSSSSTNNWANSNLNKINLNNNFYSNFDSKWRNTIENYPWIISGSSLNNLIKNDSITCYNNELGKNNLNVVTYYGNIGLMYVTDYYYAANPKYWSYKGYINFTDPGSYMDAKNDNWIHMGLNEFSITKTTSSTKQIVIPGGSGNLGYGNCDESYASVRPVFYLKDTIKYKSGTGTKADPYRIYV